MITNDVSKSHASGTNGNNGAAKNNWLSYNTHQMVTMLEYFAVGLRNGKIIIKNEQSSSPEAQSQNQVIQQSEPVCNSGSNGVTTDKPVRVKAEVVDVVYEISPNGLKCVYWYLKPRDPQATFPECLQKRWIKDDGKDFFVKKNLSCCEFPSDPLPDFTNMKVIERLIGKMVVVEKITDNDFSNAKILSAAK